MNRIFDILKKDDRPYDTIYSLYLSGELKSIFPELYNLHTDEKGYKNNFIHTLGVLKNVCDSGYDYKMKLVAVFHDIGKSVTKRYTDKGWTFHNHEIIGARMARMILQNWGIYNTELGDYVYRMILHHGRTKVHRDVTESAIRRLDHEVGQDIMFDLINFCKCDLTTRFDDKRERINSALDTIKQRIIEVREKDEDAKWRSPLTGNVVMNLLGIGEGRIVGEIKRELDPKLKSGEITIDDAIKYIKNKWLKSH
jgi:poly(A) polymerase